MLLLGFGTFLAEQVGWAPDPSPLLARGLRAGQLSGPLQLSAWALEGLALTALFLLLRGRSTRRWLEGLSAGLAAWIFRGPVALLALASVAELPRAPFWESARLALVLYPAVGLALALLAGATLERDGSP